MEAGVLGDPRCFIIAEIGVNHNGSLDRAYELIDVAASAGADAVKFQTFDAAKLARPEAEKAEYQKTQTGAGSQHEMLTALQLSFQDHHVLAGHCQAAGIEFMSTPFDLESVNFLEQVGVRRMKLPSGDINNVPMLRRAAALGMPLIVSTGMADLTEVRNAKNWIEAEWQRLGLMQNSPDGLTILHCTSNYPAAAEDVNLLAMMSMRQALGCPVGYSDHTTGIAIAIAAVALGATVIEKHVTLDKQLPGPDHAASLDPTEFHAMVAAIRGVEAARGDGVKAPRLSELPVRALVRRSISVARDVPVGQRVALDDIVMLRPANGIPPTEVDRVVGRTAARSLAAGTLLAWDDLA
jgi:N,N'-diacetyllegionaminate synthase